MYIISAVVNWKFHCCVLGPVGKRYIDVGMATNVLQLIVTPIYSILTTDDVSLTSFVGMLSLGFFGSVGCDKP